MPFRALLRFRNPDLTTDINRRFQDLIDKGVFYGGEVLPVAGALQVQVQPFGAVGADGMVTVLESTPETVSVVANATQYVVLHAEYVPNALPTVELETLSQTAYDALTDEQKRVRVRLATVTVPLGATEVTAAQISTVDADKVDPLSRSSFRGVVEDEADLPDYTDPATGETTQNRPDDLYFVSNQRVFYHWNTLGTPQWSPVIAAATELALQNHKLNQDDGTAFPDFIEAQHIGVAQREAFDVGAASVGKHGSAGTAFGATNGLVDAQYPLAVTERVDLTGLIGVTAVQLVGTFYVGTGGIGTAAQYFRLSEYQADRQLVGSDRGPIVVDQIWNSANVSQLVPSTDADDLGFYENPWVQLSFAGTIDGAFTGSLTVVANRKQTVGTLDIDALAIPRQPVGLSGQAVDIPLIGGGFTTIPTATADVQAAFDFIDTQLTSLGATPNELNWYGFQPSPISTLTGNATVSIWESKSGTHILLNSNTDEVYVGRGLTDAIILKGLSLGETVLPRGAVASLACAIKGKDSGHLFIDLQNNDGLDGVAFRYDSTNSGAPPDKIALSIQGNSGSARVFVNDYNALSPDRNFAVAGSGRFNRTGTTYLQGIDLIADATSNRLLAVSEETDQKPFVIGCLWESAGAPSGSLWFDWQIGDSSAPSTVAHISNTGAGYNRTTSSVVTDTIPFVWSFGGTGSYYDVRIESVTPGLVLEDTTGYDFRLGVQSNVFMLSVDTDGDGVRDGNQHFDDSIVIEGRADAFITHEGLGFYDKVSSLYVYDALYPWQDVVSATAGSVAMTSPQAILIGAGEGAAALIDPANPANNIVNSAENIHLGADSGLFVFTGLQTVTPTSGNDYNLAISTTGYLNQFCRTRLGSGAGSGTTVATFTGRAAPTAASDTQSLSIQQYRSGTVGTDNAAQAAIRLQHLINTTETAFMDFGVTTSSTDNYLAFGVTRSSVQERKFYLYNSGQFLFYSNQNTPTYDALIKVSGTADSGLDDIALSCESAGIRFQSPSVLESSRFRLGQYDDELRISIDTDEDGVQLTNSGHYDDLPNAVVIDNAGNVGIGIVPSVRFHVFSGTTPLAGFDYTGLEFVFESNSTITDLAVMSSNTGLARLAFHDTDGVGGVVSYNHNLETLSLSAGGTGSVVSIEPTTLEFLNQPVPAQAITGSAFTLSTVGTSYSTSLLYTVAANRLRTGSTIRIRVGGRITDANTATGVALSILVGGTTTEWVNTKTIDAASPISQQHFWLDAEARYNSSGINPSVQRLITGGFEGETLSVGCLSGNVTEFDPSTSTAIYFAVKTTSGTLNGIQVNFIRIDLAA